MGTVVLPEKGVPRYSNMSCPVVSTWNQYTGGTQHSAAAKFDEPAAAGQLRAIASGKGPRGQCLQANSNFYTTPM